ncbi:MAG: hypothetical protein U0790_17505 [Isosphaeraceae bacterium]
MSGFKSILKSHKEAKEQPAAETSDPSPAPPDPPPVEVSSAPKRSTSKPAEETKKRGRPRGKRSDKDYSQVTAYIRSATHLSVQKILLDDGKKKDFSDLVEELLSKWVRSRT